MITKYLPLPADAGGKLRSHAVLERLASLGDVTLRAFDDGHADFESLARLAVDVRGWSRRSTVRSRLRGTIRTGSLSVGGFWDERFARELRQISQADPFDVLLIGHNAMAPYGAMASARYRVLDLHNIESTLMQSYAASSSGARRFLALADAAALRRLERRSLATFDQRLVVSESDRARLPIGVDALVCPNGCQLEDPVPAATEPVAAFVGLLGWTPNAEAAQWLVRDVWPLVASRLSPVELLLVGRDPTPEVCALAQRGVTVTGTVPSVRPYLERARVAVAPLRSGGGSRLKILEALAFGRPVVSTTIGVEGLEDLVHQGVTVADKASDFADAVVELLADPARAEHQGNIGRDAVAARYTWTRTLEPLVRDIRGIRDLPGPGQIT